MSSDKTVMTVTGPINPDELGITLMHEHILCGFDWPGLWPDVSPHPERVDEPVDITNLGLLRRDVFALKDNCFLNNRNVAVEELDAFKQAGGGTVVELTSIGLLRDPAGLRDVAQRSGVHIVAGCGWYVSPSHPPYLAEESIDELTARILQDVTVGMDDTDVRSGIIGEIGIMGPMHPNEEKALRAALRTQRETGVAVNVHFGSRNNGAEITQVMAIVKEEGVSPQRMVFSHMDERMKPDYYRAAADEGFYIEFDGFGQEHYYSLHPGSYCTQWVEPRDTERIEALVDLLQRGYVSQLVLSQDVFVKTNLRCYGGWGYDHILTNVKPMFERAGITEAQLHTMMVENPAKVLAV